MSSSSTIAAKRVPLWHLLPIAAVAALIYYRVLHAPFVFDDLICIVGNKAISELGAFDAIYRYNPTRFLSMLSFAVNVQTCGTNPYGYHLINIVFHGATAMVLWWLLRLLLRHFGRLETADGGALFGALIFVAHPLQTQAVSYIWQRSSVLAVFAYLVVLVCWLHFRLAYRNGSPRWRTPWGLSLIATVAAMYTKETTFTLPLTMWAMEFLLFPEGDRLSWRLLLPPLLLSALIPLTVLMAGDLYSERVPDAFSGTPAPGAAAYLLTQVKVFAIYLRLLVLPVGQNLDHDVAIARSLLDIAVYLVLPLALLYGIWRARPRFPLLAFAGCWFLLGLSVEALAVNLPDVLFEHRMYLPLAAISLAAAYGWQFVPRRALANWAAVLLICLLAGLAWKRNEVWTDPLLLWSDAVAGSPQKARPWLSRALVFRQRDQLDAALADAEKAVALDPNYRLARVTRGLLYQALGRHEAARGDFDTALKMVADDPDMLDARGTSLLNLGQPAAALADFEGAVALAPNLSQGHHYRGQALFLLGRVDEALAAYQRADALGEHTADNALGLGDCLQKLGRLDEANEAYESALSLAPDRGDVYSRLARMWLAAEQRERALEWAKRATEKLPDDPGRWAQLGAMYYNTGAYAEAVRSFDQSLSLRVSAQDYYRRGLAHLNLKQKEAARADLARAIETGFDVPREIRAAVGLDEP